MSTDFSRLNASSPLQKNAKLAGFLCLLFSIGSMLHYSFIDIKLFLPDDPGEVLRFIQSNKNLFCFGIAADVLLFACVLSMAYLFYRILKPFHSSLALLAFVCIIIETALALNNEWSSIQLLHLANGEGAFATYTPPQTLRALDHMIDAREEGNRMVILCFNLGLLLFSYLFYQSKSLPIFLAGAGVLITLLMTILVLVRLILQTPLGALGLIASLLLLLFQLLLGTWLLFKGMDLTNRPKT